MSEKERGEEDYVPSSKLDRTKHVARAGIKVGGNYARYLARRAVKGKATEEEKDALHRENAEQVFTELTRLRGTALKMAQGLSQDTGMLPDAFVEVMSQAQYQVPPMNAALVRRILKKSLKASPEDLFASFDDQAVAAASIGQVHRATLKDGRQVAIKVQYPNVRETINSDLALLRSIIKPIVKTKNLDLYFEEVRERLLEETNYLQEAKNMRFFREQYQHDDIVTPEPVDEFTTINVLTMTFVEGLHLEPFLQTNPGQDEVNRYGQFLWDFVHRQIASNVRTIHADPHPGNYLFREDKKLGVIDFGCVKTFPQGFRDTFLQLFDAQIRKDDPLRRKLYEELEILDPEAPDQRIEDEIYDFFARFGELILLPYRSAEYDFGDPDFKKKLNEFFKEASKRVQATGSPHLIYLNKALVGLYALLIQMKPCINTKQSLRLLQSEVERIQTHKN